jgi:hypothetical protein
VLRGLLRGALVSVALPPLEAFFDTNGKAYACGGAIPRRFGLFFWGNGNLPEEWTPLSEGADWEPSPELTPLANVRDVVTVVTGLSVKIPNDLPHTSGAAGILSAARPVPVGSDYTFAQPTIDQVIAAEVGGDTLFRSIQTSASGGNGLSYNGPSSLNPPESDPYTLYTRVFGADFRLPGQEGVVDPTLALRQTVLDAVMSDIGALRTRLGSADKARLDQHLEGIRELEQRLVRLQEDPPDLDACALPDAPEASYPDVDGRPQLSARSRAMCDLIAMALACDQTRVFSHYFSDPISDLLYPGATAGHHELTHNEPAPQVEVDMITTDIMEEYAYLVDKLRSVTEGDGTLLDNCVVLGTSEVSEGRTHSVDEMPVLLAGNCCGALREGIHYRSYSQENASKLLLSVVRAMDIPLAEYGSDEAHVTDSLSDIEA